MQRISYIVKVNNFIMMTQQLTYIICVYVERKKNIPMTLLRTT